MYATGNKKMLNMLILEILRKYSDEKHPLTQQQIIKLLKQNYGMECDRRSVKNNVEHLAELGYEISMDKGYYLMAREFDDAELRILIDSVLFSKSISTRQAQGIIDKLKKFASDFFIAKVSHIKNLPSLNRTINKQAMYALDTINDAISERKKISFLYNEVGTDFKLHPRKKEPSVFNPYEIVANNGRFYLIGNYEKYDNIAHLRIDRMTEVEMLDERVKPLKHIPGYERGFDLPKHMAEHIYMFRGPSETITIRTTEDKMTDLVDWFGTDFSVTKGKGNEITVRLKCNIHAMEYWALQYGPSVEVLKPESLRKQICEDIRGMADKYGC